MTVQQMVGPILSTDFHVRFIWHLSLNDNFVTFCIYKTAMKIVTIKTMEESLALPALLYCFRLHLMI